MNKAAKNIIKTSGSLVVDLLVAIADFYDSMPRYTETRGAYEKRINKLLPNYSPAQISQGIYYLKKRGLIAKKHNKAASLTITGRQKILINKLRAGKWSPNDGNSCIIIFDIPETKRKHRRFLHRLLVNNGFINLQRSVMIGPNFLPDEFIELLKEMGLRQNVTIIKGQILFK